LVAATCCPLVSALAGTEVIAALVRMMAPNVFVVFMSRLPFFWLPPIRIVHEL
jgi:hypothetical protein